MDYLKLFINLENKMKIYIFQIVLLLFFYDINLLLK